MNRNDRKILKLAEERKWKVTKVPNKLEQIKRKAGSFPESLAGLKPGRTIIVVNNEIVWQRKKE